MTLYGEPQVWREQFPLGEARPFTHDYHGLRYPGHLSQGEFDMGLAEDKE